MRPIKSGFLASTLLSLACILSGCLGGSKVFHAEINEFFRREPEKQRDIAQVKYEFKEDNPLFYTKEVMALILVDDYDDGRICAGTDKDMLVDYICDGEATDADSIGHKLYTAEENPGIIKELTPRFIDLAKASNTNDLPNQFYDF